MENPFCFSTFHQRQRKMRTTGLLPRHSQNGKKNRTRFVNNVARKTFPVLSIGTIRFSRAKSTQRSVACRAVVFRLRSCVGVRRFASVYLTATKRELRINIVQRCARIELNNSKTQIGQVELSLLGMNEYIRHAKSHAAVRCVRNGSAQPFATWGIGFCACIVF